MYCVLCCAAVSVRVCVRTDMSMQKPLVNNVPAYHLSNRFISNFININIKWITWNFFYKYRRTSPYIPIGYLNETDTHTDGIDAGKSGGERRLCFFSSSFVKHLIMACCCCNSVAIGTACLHKFRYLFSSSSVPMPMPMPLPLPPPPPPPPLLSSCVCVHVRVRVSLASTWHFCSFPGNWIYRLVSFHLFSFPWLVNK